VTGPVDVQDLFLSFKGKFENFYLPSVYNIKPIPLVLFLEDELTFINRSFNGNGLDFFKQGG